MLACRSPRAATGRRYREAFTDGISRQEIVPAFFQPALSIQVLGWYTTSGS
jgi:hypothetical protein